jgi:hypothetical protein
MGVVMSVVMAQGEGDVGLPSSEKAVGEKVVGDIVIYLGRQRAGQMKDFRNYEL